jgi:hypothetical protein
MTTHPFNGPIPFEVLERTGDSTVTQPGLPPGIRRTGRFITQVMPIYDRFEPVLSIQKPDAYILPNDSTIVALLRLHGLSVTPFVPAPSAGRVSVFTVDSAVAGKRAFQGHNQMRLTGTWSAPAATNMPSGNPDGYVVVSATGRFGPLAAYLLEPQSDDGLADWNFYDASIKSGAPFPVTRLYK